MSVKLVDYAALFHGRRGGRRRRGGGRQYVRLQGVPAGSGDRYLARRGDTGQGAQVPRRAPEERPEEERLRQRARHAAEHADAGEQAVDPSSGAPRLVQVSTPASRRIRFADKLDRRKSVREEEATWVRVEEARK